MSKPTGRLDVSFVGVQRTVHILLTPVEKIRKDAYDL